MAGFMAGFGTTMSNLIEEDRKYYRESAAKRRDYLQTYGTKAVVDREEKANAALGTVNSLITSGIPEEDVRYVLDTSGVQGIAQLQATIKSRTDLSAEERQSLVKKAKDYVADNPDEDINTVIKRAYGLYKSTDKPVERERNLMSSILGLDARMMEDEVLNDMYVNGMTGRDIYRIMGSSGPKAGEALSLNLPAKPPSSQDRAAAAKTLVSQFESSITGRINAAKRANDPALVAKLEGLQARGVEGIADYALEYDTGLLDFASEIEQQQPGVITRNSINLGTFPSAFNSYIGDAQDDARVSAAATGSEADSTTPPVDGTVTAATGSEEDGTKTPAGGTVTTAASPTTKSLTFETPAEFNTAVTEGKVVPGDKVIIAGAAEQTYMPPESKAPGSLGKDDVPLYNVFDIVASGKGKKDLEAQAIADVEAIEKAATESVDAAVDASGKFLRDADLTLGKGVGIFQSVDAYLTAIGGALAKRMGASEEFTDSIFERAVRVSKAGDKVEANGLFMQNAEALNEQLQDEESFVSQASSKMMEILRAAGDYIPDQPSSPEAKDIVEKAESGSVPASITNAVRKAYTNIKDGLAEDLDSILIDRSRQPVQEDPMEARIRDDARQFRADERSYPQPLDTWVTNAPKEVVEALRDKLDSLDSGSNNLRGTAMLVDSLTEKGDTALSYLTDENITTARDEMEKGLRRGMTAGAESLIAYLKKLKVSDEEILDVLNSRGVPIDVRDNLQAGAEAAVATGVEKLRETLNDLKLSEADIKRVVEASDLAVTGTRDSAEEGLRAAPSKLLKVLKDLDLSKRMEREVLKSGGFIIDTRDAAEAGIRKGLGVR